MDDWARTYSDAELGRMRRRILSEYRDASMSMRLKAERILEQHDLTDGKAAYSKWLQDASESIARDAVRADMAAAGHIGGSVADVFAESANWAAFDVERRSGVSTDFHLMDRDAVLGLARDDPKLLPAPRVDVPRDMAWNKRHVAQALQQGIIQGEPVDRIASRLQGVADMGRRAAMRNARTAVNGAENAGKAHSYERAMAMGIPMVKEWVATLDGRTRDSHRHLDGEKVPLDEPFSNGCMFPGDPGGHPSEVYNCRCRMIAVPDGVDMSDAERNSRLPEGTTYEEWRDQARRREHGNV